MTDIHASVQDTHRAVGAGRIAAGEGRAMLLRRAYPAPVEEVWDACTSAERIGRWLTPVTGDLSVGGKYQLEGNAHGEILRCEPPTLLRVTWVFGDQPAEVELRLAPGASGDTVLELEHTTVADPAFWARFGPGAVGVGWDLALLGLGLELSGRVKDDAVVQQWLRSAEGRGFVTAAGDVRGPPRLAGGAAPAEAAAAVQHTTTFYTGGPGTVG